jgi:hypothetical protein
MALQERVQAWCAHAVHTWRLRANLFGAMPFRRASHARVVEKQSWTCPTSPSMAQFW